MRDSYENRIKKIYLIEQNAAFVENIGKKLLPPSEKIEWIVGSCFDKSIWDYITNFGSTKVDCIYSNPPFGKIPSSIKEELSWLDYQDGEFELAVMQLALKYAKYCNMILPIGSVEFKENPYYDIVKSIKVERFRKRVHTFFYMESMSIDSTDYKDEWKNLAGMKTKNKFTVTCNANLAPQCKTTN